MPTAATLLEQMAAIANGLAPLAVAWHLVLAAVLLALYGSWQPTRRTFAWLIGTLVLSVAVSALAYGNPFNAISFGLLAVLLIATSGHGPVTERPPRWAQIAGGAFVLYGGLYPHFLDAPAIAYVIAAPVGIIPCPTLAMIGGLALVTGAISSVGRAVLIGWAVVYGIIGVFYFGLWLDLGLTVLAGALLPARVLRIFQRPWTRAGGMYWSSTTTSRTGH